MHTWKTLKENNECCHSKWDFGKGEEPAVMCAACQRYVPQIQANIDHIKFKKMYNQKWGGVNEEIIVLDSNDPHSVSSSYKVHIEGTTCYISKVTNTRTTTIHRPRRACTNGGTLLGVKAVEFACIWETDLNNLQYLCGSCNESKGIKEWDLWAKEKNIEGIPARIGKWLACTNDGRAGKRKEPPAGIKYNGGPVKKIKITGNNVLKKRRGSSLF